MTRSKLGLQVLYVSGEDVFLSMGNAWLVDSGCGVQVTGGGREAIRVLERSADAFDAVVAEQHVTDMSGSELARRIRRKRPDTPVLVLSGGALESASSQLRVPFSARELRDAIDHVASAATATATA